MGSATNAATRPGPAATIAASSSSARSRRVGEGVGSGPPGAVRVGRGHVPEPAEPGLVRPAERRTPRQVEGTERVPVVAPPAGDDDVTIRLASREVVGPRELERRLDRLRAAGHRIDHRIVDRQVASDGRRVRLERLGREGAPVGVREPGGLLGHHGGDLAAAVSDVHDDRATRGIEVGPARGIADGGPLGLDRDGRVGSRGTTEDAAGTHGRDGSGPDRDGRSGPPGGGVRRGPWGPCASTSC